MRYNTIQKMTKAMDIVDFINKNNIPANYEVYVGFCDSLYAVTNVTEVDDEIIISSVETYGSGSDMCVNGLLAGLIACDLSKPVMCEAADDIDKSLDLQMDKDTPAVNIAVDNICKMLVIIAE